MSTRRYLDQPTGDESIEEIRSMVTAAEEAGDRQAAMRWKGAWTRQLAEAGGADGNVDREGFRASAEVIRGSVGGDGEAGGEEEAT